LKSLSVKAGADWLASTVQRSFTLSYSICSWEDSFMSDHVYKKVELIGSSPKSIEAAVENALARAKKTIRNMRWLEVTETRGHIQDGKIDHWQVAVKVGFTLED
jgi:dodecin